ncbi:MAG: 3-dehydroquinate synthase [Paludibacteraceae bacterium]|nr:3-dehydroquinate synthase [Paludibacteraceae bacterium]
MLFNTSSIREYLCACPTGQLFVLTDTNTAAHCLPIFADFIGNLPYHLMTLDAGDTNKNINSVQLVWEFLLKNCATRQALLVNLGGGIVTDLGGFAAATYMRGIRFVNIPTTLLAMVDASSGGKTGCNFLGVKNAIGTFTQPLDTLICPSLLKSLPATEWLSGYAEMLKHGLIADKKHWQDLLAWDIHQQDIATLTPLIADSLAIKKQIAEADPYEVGIRKVLNFGHTIGHAIEAAYIHQGLQPYHGYCVLWGMVAEVYLSVVHTGCPREILTQLTHLMVEYYGKPECNCRQREQLMEYMMHDKKNRVTTTSYLQINFTLLRDIGAPIINQELSRAAINEALEYLFSI